MIHPLPLMRTHLRKSLHGGSFPMAHLLRVPAMLALSACAAQAAAIQSNGWNLIGVGNCIAASPVRTARHAMPIPPYALSA